MLAPRSAQHAPQDARKKRAARLHRIQRLIRDREVLAATQPPRWVIDGNYSAVRDIMWRRCTTIVWLDYSFARVFSRALRRTVRRVVTGERLFGGNRETIGNQLFAPEGVFS